MTVVVQLFHSQMHTLTRTYTDALYTFTNALKPRALWINKNVHITFMKGNSSSIHINKTHIYICASLHMSMCSRTVKCSRYFPYFHFDYTSIYIYIYLCVVWSIFFEHSFHFKHSSVNLLAVSLCYNCTYIYIKIFIWKWMRILVRQIIMDGKTWAYRRMVLSNKQKVKKTHKLLSDEGIAIVIQTLPNCCFHLMTRCQYYFY